jgi:superfamily II DNA or RNA helicase
VDNDAFLNSETPQIALVTIQSLETALQHATPAQTKALRAKLGVMVFDEAHHLGAPTYLEATRTLLKNNSGAKLLGGTATPGHRKEAIQELFNTTFEGKSFWAYLDHLEQGDGIERNVRSVMDQLDTAIQSGELTPLEHFYMLDQYSFSTDKAESIFEKTNLLNKSSSYRIRKNRYPELTKRLAPLVDRHKSGFFAANSIEEANELQRAFTEAMPGKKFAVFHGDLSPAERNAIRKRMESGEDLFLFTVDLLDEGVNFPHMSLYVDLNRSVGARQLLQRWGRVARLSQGKEGVEIATLSDWTDAGSIGDKLELLEKMHSQDKMGKAFKGAHVTKGSRPSVNFVSGLTPIDDETKKKEYEILRTQMREIFDKRTTGDPFERLNAIVKSGNEVPSSQEDLGIYRWIERLPEDRSLWPKMDEDVKAAIIRFLGKKRKKRENLLIKLISLIESGEELSAESTDLYVRKYIFRLPKEESLWPAEMNEEVRAKVRAYRQANSRGALKQTGERTLTEKKPKVIIPLVRMQERVKAGITSAPNSNEDPVVYRWIQKLPEDTSKWPHMDEPTQKAIIATKVGNRYRSSVLPRLEAYIKAGTPIPDRDKDLGAYHWIMSLTDDEAFWPEEMSEALKNAVRARRKILKQGLSK